MSSKVKALAEENAILRQLLADVLWMAQRYADGRSTYAVGMYNDAAHTLLGLGFPLRPDPTTGTIWAEDGMFGYPRYAEEAGELHRPLPALKATPMTAAESAVLICAHAYAAAERAVDDTRIQRDHARALAASFKTEERDAAYGAARAAWLATLDPLHDARAALIRAARQLEPQESKFDVIGAP